MAKSYLMEVISAKDRTNAKAICNFPVLARSRIKSLPDAPLRTFRANLAEKGRRKSVEKTDGVTK
jgi:hypothetical protein